MFHNLIKFLIKAGERVGGIHILGNQGDLQHSVKLTLQGENIQVSVTITIRVRGYKNLAAVYLKGLNQRLSKRLLNWASVAYMSFKSRAYKQFWMTSIPWW